MTKRQAILEVLVARIGEILVSNGYATDAGAYVLVDHVGDLGPDDPAEAIGLIVGDERLLEDLCGYGDGAAGELLLELPIQVAALVNYERHHHREAWRVKEALLGDIKRAMDLDRTFGGLLEKPVRRGPARTIPREPGSRTLCVGMPCVCTYLETWGDPFAGASAEA